MSVHETTYFRAERTPPRQGIKGSWRARAIIRRKDSDEVVDQISIQGCADENSAEDGLRQTLQARLSALSKPSDWGKDNSTSRLIREYLARKEEAYHYQMKAHGAPPSERQAILDEGEAFLEGQKASFRRIVASLNEDRRVALITPTPYQAAHPDDPWVLDDLGAKKDLYRLITDPTPRVQAAYRSLHAVLNATPVAGD
jgi:hypothetical protein